MKNTVAHNAIKQIAAREGKQESEVRREIEKAILYGALNPLTRKRWMVLFGTTLPSPEEFIMTVVRKVSH